MASFSAFLSELKRRRVFRVAVVYAGVAFIIIQLVDGIFDIMGTPPWVGQVVVVLLVLGFPIAVALAWAFDITEKGIVRTKGKPPAPTNLETAAPTIAVLSIKNDNVDPELDYFSNSLQNLLISELSRISGLIIRSQQSTLRFRGSTLSMPEIAEALQADILVAAMGSPKAITADMVREGVVVVDVGVNRVDDPSSERGYHLEGDVDFEAVSQKAEAISPVPGGVGPMTITMLLVNTLTAARISAGAA